MKGAQIASVSDLLDLLAPRLVDESQTITQDTRCWAKWYGGDTWYANELGSDPVKDRLPDEHFRLLFRKLPEFRSLFDYRCHSDPTLVQIAGAVPTAPRATELHLRAGSIGPRCRIQHGHNARVSAESIGSDFFVSHNVTIGWAHGQRPTIGNRVAILVGAVVAGGITIGDDVTIGPNAVVNFDIPSGAKVYAQRPHVKLPALER